MKKLFSLSALALLAACVRPPVPAPKTPVAAPPPPLPPAAAPLPSDWMDWPITPGDWGYRQDGGGSVATFGRIGADADFVVRCDKGARRIRLSRPGILDAGKTAQMTLRATAGIASYRLVNGGDTPPHVIADLVALDPFLDKIAFSRGRFLVQVEGAQDLVLPNWAEFARVIEDCRG